MTTHSVSPKREDTPSSTIPTKRILDEDHHQPSVSSPLNPDFSRVKDEAPQSRDRAGRSKKESLKKRESKGGPLAPESSLRPVADPKAPTKIKKEGEEETILAPLRYKLPPPKITDFEPARSPVFTFHHAIRGPDGSEIDFHETSEHVFNKKNFRYTHCIADPGFPSTLHYRQTETEPFTSRFNFEDVSGHMFHDVTGCHITTDKGFRMAKSNICIREGRFYWECKVTSGVPRKNKSEPSGSTGGHVRMGFARREASLDGPVGFDAYSYGIRDVAGQKMFMSRPKDFFPTGEDIEEGDVIGLEINLPSQQLHRKVVEGHYNPAVDLEDTGAFSSEAADVIRDRVPIRFKSHLYFEQIDYLPTKELEELMNPSPIFTAGPTPSKPSPTHPLPAMRTLPHSSINIYKNGIPMGTAFTDLLAFLPPASRPVPQVGAREGLDDGMLGYFPAVSVFRGGAAEINLGPDFWYPPQGRERDDEVDMIGSDQVPSGKSSLKPASDRYDEQIVEDIVRDIIDEVDFWVQDGCPSDNAASRAIAPTMNQSAVPSTTFNDSDMASGEIKELVQDDE